MPATDMDHTDLNVRVTPRASKSEVIGIVDGVLKVRIAAPPVDGAANEALIKLLAKHFNVSKSSISIVSGDSSRNKRVRISGTRIPLAHGRF